MKSVINEEKRVQELLLGFEDPSRQDLILLTKYYKDYKPAVIKEKIEALWKNYNRVLDYKKLNSCVAYARKKHLELAKAVPNITFSKEEVNWFKDKVDKDILFCMYVWYKVQLAYKDNKESAIKFFLHNDGPKMKKSIGYTKNIFEAFHRLRENGYINTFSYASSFEDNLVAAKYFLSPNYLEMYKNGELSQEKMYSISDNCPVIASFVENVPVGETVWEWPVDELRDNVAKYYKVMLGKSKLLLCKVCGTEVQCTSNNVTNGVLCDTCRRAYYTQKKREQRARKKAESEI